MLDPTSSILGYPLSTLSWRISSDGNVSQSGLAEANSILNSADAGSPSLSFTYIPSGILPPGAYSVTLSLSSPVGCNSLDTKNFSVVAESNLLTVSIDGPALVSRYNYQTIAFQASAFVTSCDLQSHSTGNFSQNSTTVDWLIRSEDGASLNIRSSSLSKNVMRISPYSLNGSSNYFILARATYAGLTVVSEPALLRVVSAGVSAVITGGSTRVVSAFDELRLDASASVDLDRRCNTDCLFFSWICLMNYSAEVRVCNNTPVVTSAVLTVEAGILNTSWTYNFTAIVSNRGGVSSSASVLVSVLNAALPMLSVNQYKAKYNRGEKIVVVGKAVATSAFNLDWDSDDVDLSSVGLTPTSKRVTRGSTVEFPLAIDSGTFEFGRPYTFSLRGYYSAQDVSAVYVTVALNSPPNGGTFSVSPHSGTAMETAFSLVASLWADDPSDYPLRYEFGYFVLSASNLVLVSPVSESNYATCLLGQGLEADGYQVNAVVYVSDTLGASTSMNRAVTVRAVSRENLAAFTQSLLAASTSSGDPSKVMQVLSASLSALNAVNCSTAIACVSINRGECSYTPHTCGSCLDGFIGVEGESNTACVSLSSASMKSNAACLSDSDCILGTCSEGLCVEPSKVCALNCSDSGTCVYYSSSSEIVADCAVSDSSCIAKCKCSPGFYGSFCSMNAHSFVAARDVQQSVCESLMWLTSNQDADSVAVIASRAKLVASALLDMNLISDAAWADCSLSLTRTLIGNPVNVDGRNRDQVVSALSAILERQGEVSLAVLTEVDSALSSIVLSSQSQLVVGEQPASIITSNVRILSFLSPRADLSNIPFKCVSTALETLLNKSVSLVTMQLANTEGPDLGVAILQYRDYPGAERLLSSVIEVLISSDASFGSSRRLLDASSMGATITIESVNWTPVSLSNYSLTGSNYSHTGSVRCSPQQSAYNMTVECGSNSSHLILCPKLARIEFNYTCPSQRNVPQCVLQSEDQFIPSSQCFAVNFSASSTTCSCSTVSSSATRRLSLGTSIKMSLSTSVKIVGTSFAARAGSVENLDESDLTRNLIVTITTGSLLAVVIIGLVVFIIRDRHEYVRSLMKKKTSEPRANIRGLFDVLLPAEFSALPWNRRWWQKMMQEHEIISLWMPYAEGEHFKTTKWLLAMGKILNRFFVMTLLANLYFRDDGYCKSKQSEGDCLVTRHLDQVDTLCVWEHSKCTFNYIYPTFLPLLVLVVIVCILTLPLDSLYEFAVLKIQHFADSKASALHLGDHVHAEDPNLALNDDDLRGGAMNTDFLLAARIEVMRDKMDRKRVEDEMRGLLEESSPENWHPLRRSGSSAGYFSSLMRFVEHVRLRFDNSADPVAASHIMNSNEEAVILSRLKKARRKAYLIKMNMRGLHSEHEQELYLLQAFIVHSMRGFSHYIAYRHLFEEFDARHELKKYRYVHYICIVLVPLYICTIIFYIFLFGSSLKAKTANFWFTEILIVTVMSNFIIIPLVILIKFIVVPYWARKEIQVLFNIIKLRGRTILRRSIGMVTQTNGLMHYFNPACRTARLYPLLPASRLLIGMNDFDTSASYTSDRTGALYSILFKFSFMPFIVLFLLTFLLPYTLQDAFIEAVAISGFLFAVYSSYLISRIEILIPLVTVGSLFAIGLTTYFCIRNNPTEDKAVEVKPSRKKSKAVKSNKLDGVVELPPSLKPKASRYSRANPKVNPIDANDDAVECFDESTAVAPKS